MPKDTFANKSVVVTGAASGIGQATAIAFAERGAKLFLCDIDHPRLAGTVQAVGRTGAEVHSFEVDVSNRDAMKSFAETVHSRIPAVDVLVNNAGVGLGGGFLDTTLDDWEWILSINLLGVVHGCHFFVPQMVRAARRGQVVNVASAAGLLAPPDLAAYGATKYAVVGLSEALREELRPHDISVTTICPGMINTPITRSSRLRGARAGSRERLIRMYEDRGYGPERVAEAIVGAVVHRRGLVPVTPEAWLLYVLKRVMPNVTPQLLQRIVEARLARRELRPGE
ncbi:MAG TPA: SDR family NAD(P)-dependent oxidoreductase [Polyangiaceae bacterium]|nr:SDR family NAD(P)-dependent oxidoreductase [Polyangiaceae bacterium]